MKPWLLHWPAIDVPLPDKVHPSLWIRLSWMAGIWAASIGALLLVALLLRLVLKV